MKLRRTVTYRVTHCSKYLYQEPVTLGHSEVHLQPRPLAKQNCLRFELSIVPEPRCLTWREDFFGNSVHYFAVQEPHQSLSVTAVSEVAVSPDLPPATTSPWDEVVERLQADSTPDCLEARQYLLESPKVPLWVQPVEYARPSFPPGRSLLEAVGELTERIHRDFIYEPGFTTVSTPLSEVFAHRRGVCQDFAHFAIACLRGLGLAARYVSGYIETLPPPGQERPLGADASHAWFSVFDPSCGWLDFDPTNNQIPLAQHITVAWGRDYSDVAPLKGVIYGGGRRHELQVEVNVVRLAEEMA